MSNCSISTKFMLCFAIISTVLLMDFASAASLDCAPIYACHQPYKDTVDKNMHHHRKILLGFMGASSRTREMKEGKTNAIGVEMRSVPSGPDPLHHRGSPQKKPRTSP